MTECLQTQGVVPCVVFMYRVKEKTRKLSHAELLSTNVFCILIACVLANVNDQCAYRVDGIFLTQRLPKQFQAIPSHI